MLVDLLSENPRTVKEDEWVALITSAPAAPRAVLRPAPSGAEDSSGRSRGQGRGASTGAMKRRRRYKKVSTRVLCSGSCADPASGGTVRLPPLSAPFSFW